MPKVKCNYSSLWGGEIHRALYCQSFEQTLDDMEFIFVDDCTPDRSMEILGCVIEKYRLRFAEKNYIVRTDECRRSSLPAVRYKTVGYR